MVAAVGEVNVPMADREYEDEKADLSKSDILWKAFENAIAYRDSLGNISLLGIVTVNWREIPCVVGLAYAVISCATSLLFLSAPPFSVILLATASGTGIYYIRDSLNMRSLNSQINQLKAVNARLEQLRIRYEHQGESVEATLKELQELETRLLQIKAALDQTNKLLGERESEYRALNEDHRKLYLKYEALLESSQ